jgi:hypothetical protein
MKDPLYALQKVLQPIFQLEEMTKRNGKYTYRTTQKLLEALDVYVEDPNPEHFKEFTKALKDALPNISQRRIIIDFDPIKEAMDKLALHHSLDPILWKRTIGSLRLYPKTGFWATQHTHPSDSLLEWIKADTPPKSAPLDMAQALVSHRNKLGFSPRLSAHLRNDPDFLFDLIMESEKNFMEICNTRLVLYLTDVQLATAIIKHIPALTNKHQDPFEQVSTLIERLNDILSNGRSVTTLLRNKHAKAVLDDSIYFQIHQNAELQIPEEEEAQQVPHPPDTQTISPT